MIFIIAIGYGYFYLVIKKTKQSIVKKEEIAVENKQDEMVKNLDEFLDDEELKK